MTLFQNLILFTNRHGNLQEMLEVASFLKYVDLYLTSEWGRFYVGRPVVTLVFAAVTISGAISFTVYYINNVKCYNYSCYIS
jgi:hypothetical protein